MRLAGRAEVIDVSSIVKKRKFLSDLYLKPPASLYQNSVISGTAFCIFNRDVNCAKCVHSRWRYFVCQEGVKKTIFFFVTVVGNKKSLSHDSLTFSEHSWSGTVL